MDATSRNDPSPGGATRDGARDTGPALESWYRFLLWLVPAMERFPRRRKLLLGDRIQNAALNILESLVEATYSRRREPLLAKAGLGIEKLRFLFRLATDLGYLDPRRHEHATRSLLPARSTARAGDLTGPPGERPSVQGRS